MLVPLMAATLAALAWATAYPAAADPSLSLKRETERAREPAPTQVAVGPGAVGVRAVLRLHKTGEPPALLDAPQAVPCARASASLAAAAHEAPPVRVHPGFDANAPPA